VNTKEKSPLKWEHKRLKNTYLQLDLLNRFANAILHQTLHKKM